MGCHNPWHDLEAGKDAPHVVRSVIEIPMGSHGKFELDKESGMLAFDRVLFPAMYYPANYGFIPKSYCDDKDPLDVLVISEVKIPSMCLVDAKVIGVLHMIDGGEGDDKIIAVANDDPMYKHVEDIADLSPHLLDQIKNFFATYKILEKKEVEVSDFKGKDVALKVVEDSLELYKKEFA